MKIIEKDLRKGYIKIVPENEDDLWILYNTIAFGDIVTANTTRDIKFGDTGKSSRIPMTLSIKVTSIEFQPFTDRLRIRGIVVDGPEKFGVKGKYHTLNIEPGRQLVIWKERWSDFQLKKLEESSIYNEKIVITVFDYDEACIVLLTYQGTRVLKEFSSNLPGKNEPNKYSVLLKKYLENIVNDLRKFVEEYNARIVIIASPGDLCKRVAESIRGLRKDLIILTDSVSIGGCSGLNEVLRRDSVKNALKKLSIIRGGIVLEEFKKYLVKEPDMIAYGLDDVEYAVKQNAVDKLVVLSDFLRTYDEEIHRRINELLEEAYRRRAEIIIIPTDTELGIELKGLGGIIALLRYPLPRP